MLEQEWPDLGETLRESVVEGDLDGIGRQPSAPLDVLDDLLVSDRSETLTEVDQVPFELVRGLEGKEPPHVGGRLVAAQMVEE